MTEIQQRLRQLIGRASGESSCLELVILYEDLAMGLATKLWFEQVFGSTGPLYHSHLNMWKFNLLRVKALRSHAVLDARGASIVCLAAHTADFPPELHKWFEEWTSVGANTLALVVLLEGEEEAEASPAPALLFFQKFARENRLEFIVSTI